MAAALKVVYVENRYGIKDIQGRVDVQSVKMITACRHWLRDMKRGDEWAKSFGIPPPVATNKYPVSYTHLTLPTICSV
eukprot:3214568-Alexandrium_andersonii.AAC.1